MYRPLSETQLALELELIQSVKAETENGILK